VALALIDIDDLKLVNDAHGHARGDLVIRRAAEALREVAWRVPGVVAARVGGDEFALVVVGPHAAEAGIVVEQVRADLLAGDPVVHVSAGIAIALQRPVDVHTMYAAADASQYTAKRGGRSRVAAPVVVEPGADPVADLAGAGPAEPPGPSERRRRRVAGGEAATQAGPDAGPDAAR
jgi:diguanylate cyclase (GGDEF)-like protein